MKIVKQLVMYGIIGGIVAITSMRVPQIPWHPALVGFAAAILLRGIV